MAPPLEPSFTPLPHATSVLGPPIVGVTLNWFLYGILVMQYFIYLNSSRGDKKWLRAVVLFLFMLDTAQSLMSIDDIFFWYVYNFGNYTALLEFNIATIDGPLIDALIMLTVQLVYSWRVRVLGGWRIMPAITVFLSFVACACGMFIGINDIIVDPIAATRFRPVELTWLFSSAVCDILIAGSMAYLLLHYRRDEKNRGKMAMVKRFLLLTIETNAVTAALAIVLIIAFLVESIEPPHTNIYMPVGYIIGKMYSNCFMVLLNQRNYYEVPKSSGGLMGMTSLPEGQTTGQTSIPQFNASRRMITEDTSRIGVESTGAKKYGHDSVKSSSTDFV